MKCVSLSTLGNKALLLLILLCAFQISSYGRKIYITKGSDNGKYMHGASFSYLPGDTLVLRASGNPYSYMSMESIKGTATAPVVIMNEGGQVTLTNGFSFRNSRYIKLLGTGSGDRYGFKIYDPNKQSVGVNISARSSDIEVSNVHIQNKDYGFWVKEEANCADSLNHPNWTINNISLHDLYIKDMGSQAFYMGSTSPSGMRDITCNGVVKSPVPMRLSNIKVYNNIIENTGRSAIQLSGADQGTNEIYNNTITNSGLQFDVAQGNGIVLGGYTQANVHHNTINYTYTNGIFSLGAGLVRIEHNRINYSGNLSGRTAAGSASIMVDTRATYPTKLTTFVVTNNVLGSHTDHHVRVYKHVNTYSSTGNMICSNTTTNGGTPSVSVFTGISWANNCNGTTSNNQLPEVSAGVDKNIFLPTNSVLLQGTATDADGNIGTWQWTQVSGPSTAALSGAATANLTASSLVQGTYVFRLTVKDNVGGATTDDVQVIVDAATAAGTIKIEAESYKAMQGVMTDKSLDAGGGLYAGWFSIGDWMDYSVNVPTSGTYTLALRVATVYNGAQMQLRTSTGTSLATVNVPNTGNLQTWRTVETTVSLKAGTQTLRIAITGSANWHLNWWSLTPQQSTTTTTTTTTSTKVEAEAFKTMSGIQTQTTSDVGGGLNVGWINSSDWMEYAVSMPAAGTYTLSLRIATPNTGAQLQVRNASGTTLATVSVPNTGGYQTWKTITASVSLPAGSQSLRLVSTATPGWNINWLSFAASTSSSTSTSETVSTTTTPTRVQAESYAKAYGVTLTDPTDSDGTKVLTRLHYNDYMLYNVNIATAGTYSLEFRVASAQSTEKLELQNSAGQVLATIQIPQGTSLSDWKTVNATAQLPAGSQSLKVVVRGATSGAQAAFNWWAYGSSSSTSEPASTTTTTTKAQRIQAESYVKAYGVTTSSATDGDGTPVLTRLHYNDYMQYDVNISTAGTYAMRFRVASMQSTEKLELQDEKGTVLTTVKIPQGTSLSDWKTVSVSASLPRGTYKLKVVVRGATSGAQAAFNWWELQQAASTELATEEGQMEVTASLLSVYPNPAQDRVVLKVSTPESGAMKVRVIDAQGAVVRQFALSKSGSGPTQSYLSLGNLAAGTYTLQVQVGQWSESIRLIKQ